MDVTLQVLAVPLVLSFASLHSPQVLPLEGGVRGGLLFPLRGNFVTPKGCKFSCSEFLFLLLLFCTAKVRNKFKMIKFKNEKM